MLYAEEMMRDIKFDNGSWVCVILICVVGIWLISKSKGDE